MKRHLWICGMIVGTWAMTSAEAGPEKPLSREQIIQRIENLRAATAEKIVGQDEAVTGLYQAVMKNLTGTGADRGSTFLFYGLEGTGHSTLPKVTAEAAGLKYLRLEMEGYYEPSRAEEFEHKIMDALRDDPSTLIHADNVERAHPLVQARLAQLMKPFDREENATIAFKERAPITNRRSIIVVTTQAAQRQMQGSPFYYPDVSVMGFLTPSLRAEVEEAGKPRMYHDEQMQAMMAQENLLPDVFREAQYKIGLRRPAPQEYYLALVRKVRSAIAGASEKLKSELKLMNEKAFINALASEYREGMSSYKDIDLLIAKYVEPLISDLSINPELQPSQPIKIRWKGPDHATRHILDCYILLL